MRRAETVLTIIRVKSEKVTGELLDTETVTSSSEGGRWKSTRKGNSLAAYPALTVSSGRGGWKSAHRGNSLAAYSTACTVLKQGRRERFLRLL
jgi:hypothetical protein